MEADETLKSTGDYNMSDQGENFIFNSLTESIVKEALELGNQPEWVDFTAIDKQNMAETECFVASCSSKCTQDNSKTTETECVGASCSNGSSIQGETENRRTNDGQTIETECVDASCSSSAQDEPPNVSPVVDVNCPEALKTKSVQIYVEDTGPKFYPIKGSVITPPILSKNLPEAFKNLPVYGKPRCKSDLEEFQYNKIREYVGFDLNDNEFDKLTKYCSPVHLQTGKEVKMPTNIPRFGILPLNEEETTDGDNLKIVKKFKMRAQNSRGMLYIKKLKYRGMRMLPMSLEDSDDLKATNGTPLEPGKDLLFRVRFYRPFFYGRERNNSRHSVFSNDVIVHGRCLLGALRERIICANDVDLRLDVSDAPYDAPSTTAKELFPSGFMFINNVFYVDQREGRKDYSEPIREWCKRRGIGDFPKRDMNTVRVDELLVKMGHPEVYMHQGNCEHLFTFSEIRLVGAGDPLLPSQYPRHSCVLQHQTVYCTTCAEFGAKWLVTGCARVPFDPAFFCETCFKLYLYNDGRKIGEFKAYSFRGNEINVLKPSD